ncbi:MAG: hypothetical protein Q8Q24_02315 [bacterium]|nr:hypothetical protein [bacterium]
MSKQGRVHRKNFLPAFLASLLVWLIFLYFVLTYAPETTLLVGVFYLLLFFALFFTLALFLANSRRGLLVSLAIVGFLFLNQIKQANTLNYILLAGLLLSIELFFTKKN